MCEYLRVLNNKGLVPMDESSKPNPSVVILKGEFEHGGDTLVKDFIDFQITEGHILVTVMKLVDFKNIKSIQAVDRIYSIDGRIWPMDLIQD
jgi:hypothetical protein